MELFELLESLASLLGSLGGFFQAAFPALIVLFYLILFVIIACIVIIVQTIRDSRLEKRNAIEGKQPPLTAEQISEAITNRKKRNKKIRLIVAASVSGVIVLGIILAIAFNKDKLADIDSAVVGNRVKFGHYDDSNEWFVLDKKDDKLLVLSKYLICYKHYDEASEWTEEDDVTWSTCSLREWLNTEYLTQAFSEEEQASIVQTLIHTAGDAEDTVDKVFLLSSDEAEKYATSYKVGHGEFADGQTSAWWLRSPGLYDHRIAYMEAAGFVQSSGTDVSDELIAVRPALVIDLKTR